MKDFRFKKSEIGVLGDRFYWCGISVRNKYSSDRLTAMCFFLCRLATNCRWCDDEFKFTIFSSQLSELFQEHIELAEELFGRALKFRRTMIQDRAHFYALVQTDRNCPLDSCIGLIGWSKIRMTRPGGHGSKHRSFYSGHRRMHCLIYHTISTPDEMIF